jgi:hypothetical protein
MLGRRRLAFFFILSGAAARGQAQTPAPAPAPAPAPTPSTAAKLEYCSLLKKCGLSLPSACTDALTRGVGGVDYDAERCDPARALSQRGVDPDDPASFRLFRFLGERYQVVYRLEGSLAISVPRLNFLLDDLPLAAALLTHFQKTPYEAEYLDGPVRRRFKARRGDNLDGEATRVAGDPVDRDLVYFGRGTSKLGPWRMRGLGLVQVRYAADPTGKGLRYDLRVVAAPINAMVNLMMKTGLFRSIVLGRIREVLDDVVEASAKLEKEGAGQGGPWNAEQKEKIASLLRLP